MGESYTPLLLRKQDRQFYQKCLQFSGEVLDQCRMLKKQVEDYSSGNFGEAGRTNTILISSGNNIRKTRKHLLHEVASSGISHESKSSMFRLVYGISFVSSYIESTSSRIDLKDVSCSSYLCEGLRNMMEATYTSVLKMNETVRLLNEDLELVIDTAQEISLIEDEIDDMRRGLLKKVVNDEGFSQAQTLFSITQVLDSMETISDKVENVSNVIENIAINHLP